MKFMLEIPNMYFKCMLMHQLHDIFCTTDALDAGFLLSANDVFAGINALACFTAIVIKLVSEIALLVAVLLLALENCQK